jgi:TolB-like protein
MYKKTYTHVLLWIGILSTLGAFTAGADSLDWREPTPEVGQILKKATDGYEKDKTVTLAILDFVNIDGKQSILGRYFSELATHYFVRNSKLKILERSQINQVISELDLASTGYISDESAARLGGMLGADLVMFGTLTKVGRNISVTMKVTEIKTAAILSTGTTELKGTKYLQMYNEIVTDPSAVIQEIRKILEL